MKPGEDYIILGFISIILLIVISISFITRRKSTLHQFLFLKRMKRISWKKVGKMYLLIQGFILFCKIGNENMSWFLTILFPTILMMIIITYYLTTIETIEEDKDLQYTDEYKSYKKAVDRDNKINDILK
jgi:protein-S-isoprenylcysteine O-methyltransferase Ste14